MKPGSRFALSAGEGARALSEAALDFESEPLFLVW